jgi:hypothetical protein
MNENNLFEQLEQIYKSQPIFAGNLIHKQAKDELVRRGWVMHYQDKNISGYVCTEIGKNVYGAWLILKTSVLNLATDLLNIDKNVQASVATEVEKSSEADNQIQSSK